MLDHLKGCHLLEVVSAIGVGSLVYSVLLPGASDIVFVHFFLHLYVFLLQLNV
jgi:hypothetical protein